MAVTKLFLPCILFAVSILSATATSFTAASASIGAAVCNQTGTTSAACSLSVPIGTQTARGSGSATSTWTSSAPGTLEATASGFGSGTAGQAAVSYSNLLLVTGATGSGELQINFLGFQDNILNIPRGASVTPVTIALGSASTAATLANGAPTAFSVVLPITFNVPTLFSAAFSATATGTFFHDGTFAIDDADGILQFPSFVVENAAGLPLPNASVSFVPEPGSGMLLAGGLMLVALTRFRGKLS